MDSGGGCDCGRAGRDYHGMEHPPQGERRRGDGGHGDYPRESLQMGDWSGALDEEKCALWLLERDMRYLMIEELALEWLRHIQLTDHGVWPETIPYPAGELARVALLES